MPPAYSRHPPERALRPAEGSQSEIARAYRVGASARSRAARAAREEGARGRWAARPRRRPPWSRSGTTPPWRVRDLPAEARRGRGAAPRPCARRSRRSAWCGKRRSGPPSGTGRTSPRGVAGRAGRWRPRPPWSRRRDRDRHPHDPRRGPSAGSRGSASGSGRHRSSARSRPTARSPAGAFPPRPARPASRPSSSRRSCRPCGRSPTRSWWRTTSPPASSRRRAGPRRAGPRHLPSYPPDLNPIGPAWSKLRTRLRAAGARSREALESALGRPSPPSPPGTPRLVPAVRLRPPADSEPQSALDAAPAASASVGTDVEQRRHGVVARPPRWPASRGHSVTRASVPSTSGNRVRRTQRAPWVPRRPRSSCPAPARPARRRAGRRGRSACRPGCAGGRRRSSRRGAARTQAWW